MCNNSRFLDDVYCIPITALFYNLYSRIINFSILNIYNNIMIIL